MSKHDQLRDDEELQSDNSGHEMDNNKISRQPSLPILFSKRSLGEWPQLSKLELAKQLSLALFNQG